MAEANRVYKNAVICEPQMSKRNLYPTTSTRGSAAGARTMMNFLAYADGTNDLVDIANIIGVYAGDLIALAQTLENEGLIVKNDDV
ncbi:MAG: hypothetical protein LBF86_03055 [Helicobacteraceae bacterium]|nr:hypothetical protein [Helicobacteraceae bacterium]